VKGLLFIPDHRQLEQAYNEFLGKMLSCEQLSQYSQWSRFDPRLAEIWVKWVSENWTQLNPLELRKELNKQAWPSAAAVLIEFLVPNLADRTFSKSVFLKWKDILLIGTRNAHFEQFFIGNRSIGGTLMLRDAQHAAPQYLKWGYLARENLWNKKNAISPRNYEERMLACKSLFNKVDRITTDQYLELIQHTVSKRQAERDLAASPFLHPHRNTRGRFWTLK
jgi:hypothetical protein